MASGLTKEQIVAWLGECARVITENKERLSELDAAIGDADHGINMERGFRQVTERLPGVRQADVGAILKSVGMTLISSVGGASGPLYGTFFLRAAATAGGKEELTPPEVGALLQAGVAGVMERGRAAPGDKTMVDALQPAAEAFSAGLQEGQTLAQALRSCCFAAEQGAQATVPLLAKKGRASYLGERSVGHADPGAVSSSYLLRALSEVVDRSCPPEANGRGAAASGARSGAVGDGRSGHRLS